MNTYIFNIAQSIIAIFLAGSFLKRDKKLDTAEVIYVHPMSNADYIVGKTWGIIQVFVGLNLVGMAIAIHVFTGHSFNGTNPVLVAALVYHLGEKLFYGTRIFDVLKFDRRSGSVSGCNGDCSGFVHALKNGLRHGNIPNTEQCDFLFVSIQNPGLNENPRGRDRILGEGKRQRENCNALAVHPDLFFHLRFDFEFSCFHKYQAVLPCPLFLPFLN